MIVTPQRSVSTKMGTFTGVAVVRTSTSADRATSRGPLLGRVARLIELIKHRGSVMKRRVNNIHNPANKPEWRVSLEADFSDDEIRGEVLCCNRTHDNKVSLFNHINTKHINNKKLSKSAKYATMLQ